MSIYFYTCYHYYVESRLNNNTKMKKKKKEKKKTLLWKKPVREGRGKGEEDEYDIVHNIHVWK
jgi:hypothetical protein